MVSQLKWKVGKVGKVMNGMNGMNGIDGIDILFLVVVVELYNCRDEKVRYLSVAQVNLIDPLIVVDTRILSAATTQPLPSPFPANLIILSSHPFWVSSLILASHDLHDLHDLHDHLTTVQHMGLQHCCEPTHCRCSSKGDSIHVR
jgi:hypothetical protein